jgi:hypothetical protein
MSNGTGPYKRRLGSKVEGAPPRGRRIWGLRLLPVVFVLPTLAALLHGNPFKLLAMLAGTALLVLAGMLVRRGLDATAAFEAMRFAKPPLPFRMAGALTIGLAFLLISWFATGYDWLMGVVFGGLGVFASLITYGIDPTTAKTPDPGVVQRAGVSAEQVMAAITEAEAKIKEIEGHAATLHNRELRVHIVRIVDRAHAVLDEIERDPKDLPRARRFLNTYLDGTRNVIRDYARRQQDFAETALAADFTNVLGTIEQVFDQQVEHLKKDEALDLEVAIEVLNTQLTKEGVG